MLLDLENRMQISKMNYVKVSQADKFRRAFVVQPVHDFSALKNYAQDIRFLSTGYEDIENLEESVDDALANFDQDDDVIIPAGRVITCFIIGFILQIRGINNFIIGVYKDKDYDFYRVENSV